LINFHFELISSQRRGPTTSKPH